MTSAFTSKKMAATKGTPHHWPQFLSLFGIDDELARFDLAWKKEAIPTLYIVTIFTIILLFEFLPYLEELARGLVANGWQGRS